MGTYVVMVVCFYDYTLLLGLVAGTEALSERISRDMFWRYIIMANLFIVLLIEYVSSI